jgi:tetratricopeptide (TPR) repeat protein/Tfp pilus assembly protein PilZ
LQAVKKYSAATEAKGASGSTRGRALERQRESHGNERGERWLAAFALNAARSLADSPSRARAAQSLQRVLCRTRLEPELEQTLAEHCHEAGLHGLAARFLLRAVEEFDAAGRLNEAARALAAVETQAPALGTGELQLLADALEQRHELERAGRVLLARAEQERADGCWDEALSSCRRAARLAHDLPDLHRTWGLALLAIDDPHGALGHLEGWRRQEPSAVEPLVARIQALWLMGERRSARAGAEDLVRKLGAPGCAEGWGLQLKSCLEQRMTRSTLLFEAVQPVPFWHDDSLLAARPDRLPSASSGPHVFVARDDSFYRIPLSQILGEMDLRVIQAPVGEEVEGFLLELEPAPDLVILPFERGGSFQSFLERMRDVARLKHVPVLGITTLDRSHLDFDSLRRIGVAGLIDKSARPEHVLFRVKQLVSIPEHDSRSHPRAPVDLPVDLGFGGVMTSEYADSLSRGGMRLRSRRQLDANDDVELRFRLGSDRDLIEAEGRVIYCTPRPVSPTSYSIGIFFRAIGSEAERSIDDEVQRVLAGLRDETELRTPPSGSVEDPDEGGLKPGQVLLESR